MDEDQNICREVLKQCFNEIMQIPLEEADGYIDNFLNGNCTKMEKCGGIIFFYYFYITVLEIKKESLFKMQIKRIDRFQSDEEVSPLNSDEIFDTLRLLNFKNAKLLLNKLKCKGSIRELLCKYILENDSKKFAKKLDECDINVIMLHLKYFFDKIDILQRVANEDVAIEELEERNINLRMRAVEGGEDVVVLDTELQDFEFYMVNDGNFVTEEQRDAFYSYTYCEKVLYETVLEKMGLLTTKEKKTFHFIFCQPGFEVLLKSCQDLMNNEICEEQFLERFKCLPNIREHFCQWFSFFKTTLQETEVDAIPDQQPEPEQESSCVNNQTIPDVLSPAQNKEINDFEIRPTYFDEKQKYTNFQFPHCVIKNEKFKGIEPEKRAKDFESLIKLLAKNLCIYPSKDMMKLCAYALTGIGFKSPFELIPVYWNHKKVDILLFICQKLYNSGEKSAMTDFKTAVDVFHVRKEFENIKNPSLEGSKVNDTGFGKKFNEIYPEL